MLFAREKTLLVLSVLVLPFIYGCFTVKFIPPKNYNISNKKTLEYDFDKVWDATMEYFAENNVSIKNLDRNSGFISTDKWISPGWVNNPNAFSTVADFGDIDEGINQTRSFYPGSASFNVLIRKSSENKTTLQVNVQFVGKWTFQQGMSSETIEQEVICNSKGVLEATIMQKIIQKVK